MEFWAALYNELNRESQYFEVLIRLFDANFNSGNFAKSSEVLERLVDIDSYDYRNQERMEKLRGRVDETFLRRVAGRMAKTTVGTQNPATPPKTESSHDMALRRTPLPKKGKSCKLWKI